MMERLDERAAQRIAGPSWDEIRPLFAELHDVLIAVSPAASGELTTIYIKYMDKTKSQQPYAVLWIKKSTEMVLGLAVPESAAISSP